LGVVVLLLSAVVEVMIRLCRKLNHGRCSSLPRKLLAVLLVQTECHSGGLRAFLLLLRLLLVRVHLNLFVVIVDAHIIVVDEPLHRHRVDQQGVVLNVSLSVVIGLRLGQTGSLGRMHLLPVDLLNLIVFFAVCVVAVLVELQTTSVPSESNGGQERAPVSGAIIIRLASIVEHLALARLVREVAIGGLAFGHAFGCLGKRGAAVDVSAV
jgi:hypothetical protein